VKSPREPRPTKTLMDIHQDAAARLQGFMLGALAAALWRDDSWWAWTARAVGAVHVGYYVTAMVLSLLWRHRR
jgi:hypothetical protein